MPFLGPRDYFKLGTFNATCDVCGFKRKGFEMTMRWDGLMVCRTSVNPGCWEPRQPQDYVRGVQDNQTPPWTRPSWTADEFINMNLRPNQVLGGDPE